MIIVDPVTLGDTACTRAGTATYYDRNGVLQTAAANTLRVTYDPADLTKAPYALVGPSDVIGTNAGLVYSNVPITEPDYNAGTSYAIDVMVHDPATHLTYQSLVAANLGNALTDPTKWTKRDVTNRWKMLDQYNNTQTVNADEILLVVSSQAIAQGLYLGNIFADEIRISMVDITEGLVCSEVQSLIVSNSGSSFFNWAFRRIKRRDYFLTQALLPYANALVTICIRKDGGIPKCGMCAIGPLDEFGPSLMGLSTEGKDFSSTTFNFDGTSSTVIRPYAKRMSVDVVIDNDEIDYVHTRLFEYRQRPLVWIGGPYGCTAVFGRYGSFKNVIESYPQSKMALTIEGSV
jgi:hypothetical protein